MKKFDLYGQLTLMILSLLPFINIVNDWQMSLLFHGLFLFIIGIWQIISSISNAAKYEPANGINAFKTNLLIAAVYIIIYAGTILADKDEILGKGWFLITSFLVADILIIRYWLLVKRYYQL